MENLKMRECCKACHNMLESFSERSDPLNELCNECYMVSLDAAFNDDDMIDLGGS